MLIKNIIVLILILPLVAFAKPKLTSELEIVEPPNIKVYAFEKVLDRWGSEQWHFLDELIKRESRWNNEARNPKSSAYGLGQFLNSTWETVGCERTSDPYKQIDCTLEYISQRYGTPKKAMEFWNRKNWY